MMESSQQGDEALKEALKEALNEISRLKEEVSKLERFWELCPEHQLNGRAPTCHAKENCPFYSPNIDAIVKIPALVDTIISHLDHRSVWSCRRVSKTWKSVIQHNYKFDLHLAAGTGDLKTVEELIQQGADVKTKVYKGLTSDYYLGSTIDRLTALHCAAVSSTSNHMAIGQLLITAGADVNSASDNLRTGDDEEEGDPTITPLHIAAKRGGAYGPDFLQMLIDAGADIEAGSPDEKTPLLDVFTPSIHWLKYFTMKSVIKLKVLVKAGANVNFKLTGDDRTDESSPLHLYLAQMIMRAFRSHSRTLKEDLNVLDLMIAAGGNMNANNGRGMTPMHFGYYYHENEVDYCDESRRDEIVERIQKHLAKLQKQ